MVCSTVAPGAGAYSVYGADSSSYATYYQYSGSVHSPTQSYMPLAQNGGQSPISVDDDSGVLGHTTRASPATIQWLLDNYETADGTSLPRCTLYDHYKRHCAEHRLEPVNAASFGKLIRSVFLGLRTRRLGTRGNSKYHYYGIRIKPDSPLFRSHLEDYVPAEHVTPRTAIKRSAPTNTASRHSSSSPRPTYTSPVPQVQATDPQQISVVQQPQPIVQNATPTQSQHQSVIITASSLPRGPEIDKQSLGEGQVPQIPLPSLETTEENLRKIGMDLTHLMKFVDAYTQNCADVLYMIKQLQFDGVEDCWTAFWQAEDDSMEDEEMLQIDKLTQPQIFTLCTLPPVQNWILQMDIAFYQVIIDVLVPSVLMSQMTPFLTQQCRNFAKMADTYLKKAMDGAPDAIVKKKLQAVRYMAQGLKRYTSLNHLAQAARAVLQKQEQVTAMFHDYVRVDITQVQEQAGWVAGCDNLMVKHIHDAFKHNLQKIAPMEEWAEWMESIVDQILAKYHDKPVQTIADVGKQFLLNWSFYTSMVIRDLTLRSASSFGSFHLIRLLADDYMFYLVETRIAKAAQQPLITIIKQVISEVNWGN
ncbi:hypothetical protein WR25_03087 [Diploscapter pachys]|uniref:RFX-type winged-helix domain-containing protein n=1 Tax=Diploscapter pachys TaxID=2018661 RepID=A0A2A2L6C0_9BILA|nr:hypothetical protein WR25_03087 [Diploscapter pachys]